MTWQYTEPVSKQIKFDQFWLNDINLQCNVHAFESLDRFQNSKYSVQLQYNYSVHVEVLVISNILIKRNSRKHGNKIFRNFARAVLCK